MKKIDEFIKQTMEEVYGPDIDLREIPTFYCVVCNENEVLTANGVCSCCNI